MTIYQLRHFEVEQFGQVDEIFGRGFFPVPEPPVISYYLRARFGENVYETVGNALDSDAALKFLTKEAQIKLEAADG